jgi:phenylpyruvate tautomerase PptA (4-oxalocrotonate tautomerase family)
MPILDVEIITRPGETISPYLASKLANRAGTIFLSPPASTWVKVHTLPCENYAENDSPDSNIYPVFVSILKANLPAPDALQQEVEQLTAAIAHLCNRPAENVHIIYLPEGTGRVAFGGKIVGIDGGS